MQFLSIGVNEFAEDIVQCVSDELQQLENKDINCEINKIDADGPTSIVYSINDEESRSDKATYVYNTLIVNVSNALTDYIIKKYEEKLIVRIINNNYCYFNIIERKDILNIALRIIRNDEKNILNSLFLIRRRNIIFKNLMDYFESSNSLLLDGFVNFRLKDYTKGLEEVVDKAVDDFLMEREYKEFIRLLRYFVDIQEPKFSTVHVIAKYENKYILLDENKREITNECIREFVNEISDGEVNYDDLLVSSLITLAPKKIIIHSNGQFKNRELLETIRNVFVGKVFLCNFCEICCVNAIKD